MDDIKKILNGKYRFWIIAVIFLVLFWFNHTLAILTIIAIFAYVFYVGYLKNKEQNDYIRNHQLIINRPADFNIDENIYSTKTVTSTDDIFQYFKNDSEQVTHLKALGIGCSFENHQIKFYEGSWNAYLTTLKKKEDVYRYKFRLYKWKGYRPTAELNVVLTMLEKQILKLDSTALVQRQETDHVETTTHRGTGLGALLAVAENSYEKRVSQPQKQAAAEIIRQQNLQDLTPKTPLINDYPE